MLLTTLAVIASSIVGALGQSLFNSRGSSNPNILFIFTDDQDLELGSLQYLPTVRSRIQDQGKSFEGPH